MAVTTISLSSVKNYTDDLTKDKFDSLNFVSFDGGELATVSGNSIYNIILGDNDTAGSLTYRISAAENNILELNNKLGDGFSDTSTVTQQFSTAKERITVAEENAQVAASTLDNFLTVADGKDFLFLLDDLTVQIGRLDNLTDGSSLFYFNKNIKEWNINLPSLTNGTSMFEGCSFLIKFNLQSLSSLTNGRRMFYEVPIEEWNIELPILDNGERMFNSSKLKNWNINLPSLTNGIGMFSRNYLLSSFNSSLPLLKDATSMFYSTSLSNWEIDLPLLEKGYAAFNLIKELKNFNSNTPELLDGTYMFSESGLENFNGNLSKLKIGRGMFYFTPLSFFNIEMPLLNDGNHMFMGSSLTSFNSSLQSLNDGNAMFERCRLDLASVQNIADTINDLASQSKTGSITIGMQATLQYDDTLIDEEQPDAVVAKNAIAAIVAKGWTVTEQYNS